MTRIIALLLIATFSFSSCSKEATEDTTLHPLEGEYSGFWDYNQGNISGVKISSTVEDEFMLTFIGNDEITYMIIIESDSQFSIPSFQAWDLNADFKGELISDTLFIEYSWSDIDDPSESGVIVGEFVKE